MKKILLIVVLVMIAMGAGLLALLSNLDRVVKKGIEEIGTRVLQAPVSLDRVEIDLASGAGTLHGLTIGNPEGFSSEYAFKLERITVELEPASIKDDPVVIRRIIVVAPDIVHEGVPGRSNLDRLQANARSTIGNDRRQPEKKAEGKKVIIEHLRIEDGRIRVTAAPLRGRQLTTPLPTIELRDIGRDDETTMAEALSQVLTAINRQAGPAAGSVLDTLGTVGGEVGGAIRQGLDKGVEGVRGLFGN